MRQIQTPQTQQDDSDGSFSRATPGELVRQILKLRWMGMEEEARQLQERLSRAGPAGSVLANPNDTD
jgi:hypothetical protein